MLNFFNEASMSKSRFFVSFFFLDKLSVISMICITKKHEPGGNPWSRGRTSDSHLGDPGSIPARSKIIFLLRGSSVEAICSPGSSPGQIFDL